MKATPSTLAPDRDAARVRLLLASLSLTPSQVARVEAARARGPLTPRALVDALGQGRRAEATR